MLDTASSLLGAFEFGALPQQLVNGLLLGAIYALIALGYTMVYGVLRLINFAHGEIFMLGAYTSLFTSWALGFGKDGQGVSSPMNLVLMLLISMLVCGTIGVLVELLAYRPMRTQPRIASLITAIGLSLLFQYGGQLVLPVSPQPSINEKVNPYRGTNEFFVQRPGAELVQAYERANDDAEAADKAYREGRSAGLSTGAISQLREVRNQKNSAKSDAATALNKAEVKITIPQGQLIMLGTTIGLMLLLTYLVMFTSVGRAMRAVSHDFDSAALMGVDVNRIVTITFLIGSALAGAGAMMNATFLGTPLSAQFGVQPGIKAFVAAVLGGIGNIPGAVVGALLMGFAETLVVWAGYSQYRDAIAFVVLIGVLLLRPGGILGSSKVEKV